MAEKIFFEKKNSIEFIGYDNGVVVCRLLNCEAAALDRISKYLKESCIRIFRDLDPYEGEGFPEDLNRYRIDDVYVGLARTAPEDTFDPEVGKHLALIRAKQKRGREINAALKKFLADARKSLEVLEENAVREIPDKDTENYTDKKS